MVFTRADDKNDYNCAKGQKKLQSLNVGNNYEVIIL